MEKPRRAFLLVLQEGRPVETLPLVRETVIIGRDQGDILIEDNEISGTHCQVQRIGSGFHVFDLNSTNGTYLNGQRILKSRLNDGDVIRIGNITLKFTLNQPKSAQLAEASKPFSSGVASHSALGQREGIAQDPPMQQPQAQDARAAEPNPKIMPSAELGLEPPHEPHPVSGLALLNEPAARELLALVREQRSVALAQAPLVLEVAYADGFREELEIPERKYLVGRLSLLGRFSVDEELSRRHAQIEVNSENEIVLTDLDSTNGTFVNDERLQGSRIITHKDVVRLGQSHLRVLIKLKARPQKQ